MVNGVVFCAGVEVGDELYFAAHKRNAFFVKNRKTKVIRYIGAVKEETAKACWYIKAINYKSWVYFVPALANYIVKVNTRTLELCAIPVSASNHLCETNKFIEAITYGNTAWLIPAGYDAILELNMDTDEVTRHDQWPVGVNWENKYFYMFRTGVCVGNKVYLCPLDGQKFIIFDLVTKEMKSFDWPYPPRTFCMMLYHQGCLWFLPREEYPYIVKYSLKNNETERIEIPEEKGSHSYATAVLVGDDIVCIPYEAWNWRIIDTRTNEIKNIPFTDSRMEKPVEYPYYQFVACVNGGYKIFGDKRPYGHFIGENSFSISETEFEVDGLSWFIFATLTSDISKTEQEDKPVSIGAGIFNTVRNL